MPGAEYKGLYKIAVDRSHSKEEQKKNQANDVADMIEENM